MTAKMMAIIAIAITISTRVRPGTNFWRWAGIILIVGESSQALKIGAGRVLLFRYRITVNR